eukprot:gene1470-859_t
MLMLMMMILLFRFFFKGLASAREAGDPPLLSPLRLVALHRMNESRILRCKDTWVDRTMWRILRRGGHRGRTVISAAACRTILTAEQTPSSPRCSIEGWIYREVGEVETKDWRGTYWSASGETRLSPWHNLPRDTHDWRGGSSTGMEVVCVVEIPQGSIAKLEMEKGLPYNPIVQDVYKKKPGQPLRFLLYEPERGVPFHYGFVPRTFEDPGEVHPATGCGGDGDPLDTVLLDPRGLMVPRDHNGLEEAEKSWRSHAKDAKRLTLPEDQKRLRGSVWRCRVLGVLPMIDDGETDWKVIAEPFECLQGASLSTAPLASATCETAYRDTDDIPTEIRDHLLHWFRYYKTAENKGENTFGMDGKLQNARLAAEVVRECGRQYDRLVGTEEGRALAAKGALLAASRTLLPILLYGSTLSCEGGSLTDEQGE